MSSRTSREELFYALVDTWAGRSTCPKARVGVVVSKDGRAIASGYNSSPAGTNHCDEVGCLISGERCIRTIHAETAAISFAAREGIALKGTQLWSTFSPCYDCCKLIINVGITEIHFWKLFREFSGLDLLIQAHINIYHKYTEYTN